MAYIGNTPANIFTSLETQTITGDGSTAYTLTHGVSSGKDILVYINNVKQEEGSGKSYTATGNTITFSDAVASGDACYLLYVNRAIATHTPADASVDADAIAGGAVSSAKIAADAITGAKIADDAINSEHYTDGSIDTAHIADSQVTSAKMANNSVGITQLNVSDGSSGQFLSTNGSGTLSFATVSSAADDLTTGDAAVTLATSSGNITIDAQGNDTDIIFKGTDGSSDTTFLTIDGSEAGAATFNNKIIATELDISGDIDVDGTTNLDVVDIDGAVDMASTLGVTGVVTANAGVVIDNITIDGTEIDLSSGDLTLDVAGDIILDADGGDVKINDGGTARVHIITSASETALFNQTQDADIVFKGDDGGSTITALTLDISAAGAATFNAGATFGGALLPSSDDALDLGSSSKQWRDIYTGDINLNNTKTRDNEVDGTRGSWTIQEGEDNLFILNRLNGKKYRFKLEEMK